MLASKSCKATRLRGNLWRKDESETDDLKSIDGGSDLARLGDRLLSVLGLFKAVDYVGRTDWGLGTCGEAFGWARIRVSEIHRAWVASHCLQQRAPATTSGSVEVVEGIA